MVNQNFADYLKILSDQFFKLLEPNEEVSFLVHSEESQFVRFNQSKVRQNTSVFQHELEIKLQFQKKILQSKLNLILHLETDLLNLKYELIQLRNNIITIDPHPQFVDLENHGQSVTVKKIERPSDDEIIKMILKFNESVDMAGLYCSGPVRRAAINSKGQFHFFESDFYFFDYSIYNGAKAAKGFFSIEKWNEEFLKKNIQMTIDKLNSLNKPEITVKPGKYTVFLEPMAVQEILMTLAWGGLSMASYKQGQSPLRKFIDNEVVLSSQFNLTENLELGFVPQFNNIGELGQSKLDLIHLGKISNLLTSSATAQEYKLVSNLANPEEIFRSPELKPGSLDEKDIFKKIGTGLYLSNLHYINWSDRQTARLTGMTRFACFWVENGEIVGPIKDMRFDDSIYSLFGSNLLDLTQKQDLFIDSMTYNKRSLGVLKTPGALIQQMNFTL